VRRRRNWIIKVVRRWTAIKKTRRTMIWKRRCMMIYEGEETEKLIMRRWMMRRREIRRS
jgi:hypothetical protein